MRSVMVFGSFDPLHEGHRSLFRQALRHGEELFVGVSRDRTIKRLKGREPNRLEKERRSLVEAEPLVDKAILGDEEDFLKVVVKLCPDVIILGYDQTTYEDEELRRLLKERDCEPEIKRAVAFQPEKYKSSKM
ncbi:adenylyltransferase/cytidyltransferase family protein [Candidatus Woesearchaeota archaeon]|nr:adenylyltransferase/cytidyltransferase family protein [Candidatus Woesearchaeota archaeon]